MTARDLEPREELTVLTKSVRGLAPNDIFPRRRSLRRDGRWVRQSYSMVKIYLRWLVCSHTMLYARYRSFSYSP